MVLTRKQIEELAIYAGYKTQDISGEHESTEITIMNNGTICGEDGEPDYTGKVAFRTDYPDDGAIALD